MKPLHYFYLIATAIEVILLFAGMGQLACILIGLTGLCALLASMLTGKQSNDGMR